MLNTKATNATFVSVSCDRTERQGKDCLLLLLWTRWTSSVPSGCDSIVWTKTLFTWWLHFNVKPKRAASIGWDLNLGDKLDQGKDSLKTITHFLWKYTQLIWCKLQMWTCAIFLRKYKRQKPLFFLSVYFFWIPVCVLNTCYQFTVLVAKE